MDLLLAMKHEDLPSISSAVAVVFVEHMATGGENVPSGLQEVMRPASMSAAHRPPLLPTPSLPLVVSSHFVQALADEASASLNNAGSSASGFGSDTTSINEEFDILG